jgi:hypothetical protein
MESAVHLKGVPRPEISKERANIQVAIIMVGPRHDPISNEAPAPLYLADADLNSLHLENLGGAVLRNAVP